MLFFLALHAAFSDNLHMQKMRQISNQVIHRSLDNDHLNLATIIAMFEVST